MGYLSDSANFRLMQFYQHHWGINSMYEFERPENILGEEPFRNLVHDVKLVR